MGEKFEKVKAFCKEHKKEIAVAVVTGVGVAVGVTACVVMKKKLDISNSTIRDYKDTLDVLIDGTTEEVVDRLVKTKSDVGEKHYKHIAADFGAILEVWKPTKHEGMMVISENVTLENIGKLGEEMMKLDGNLKPDSILGVVIQDLTDK